MSISINLQKWGNSQGIRIPKAILDILDWNENENLELVTKNNQIIIKKIEKPKKNIQELFKNFDGNYKKESVGWGEPVGKEIW